MLNLVILIQQESSMFNAGNDTKIKCIQQIFTKIIEWDNWGCKMHPRKTHHPLQMPVSLPTSVMFFKFFLTMGLTF